jgi:predicted N-acyltransferase
MKHPYRVEWKGSMSEIPKQAWDALAEPLPTPALEWEWLARLESSGSVCPDTGWLPAHLTVWQGADLVAAAPLYVKGHSEGEFVWDYAWAEVASRLAVRYYPKLVGVSPATPVPGYRFLLAPGQDEEVLTGLMLEAIESFRAANRLSGVSFLYVDPDWQAAIEARGYLAWRHQSFLWENEGYGSFEDYLARFDKNQRRNIRRELQAVESQGVRLEIHNGERITREALEQMVEFYEGTNDQFGPWAARYLTPRFLPSLYEGFRHRLLLASAFRRGESRPVGMSFLLTKGQGLYGRYWGSRERIDSLHFAACYYEPIRWAIQNGVRRFDPGIGSEHKLRRGFRAVANHSLHRFADPRLRGIMQRHIERINSQQQEEIDALNRAVPFAEGRDQAQAEARPQPGSAFRTK